MSTNPPPLTPPSEASRHHVALRQAALAAHPELARLQGANPWTALAIPVLLAIHWSVAAWVGASQSLLLCMVLAFFVGQWVIHAAGGLVHETSHRLILRSRAGKLLVDLGLEWILASFARQLTYQHEHVSSHHRYQGDYERDYEHEDLCAQTARLAYTRQHPRRQRLVTLATLALHSLPFGFLLSDWLMPRFYRAVTGRAVCDAARRIPATRPTRQERRLFMATSLLSNLALLSAFGWLGWLYHNWALSFFLGKMGVSNLGQSLSEHEGDDPDAPTRSTYGPVNLFLFNTGHHLEHHVFVNVPWNRLPALHRAAPEVFRHENTRSYAWHWWRHVRADFSPSRRNALQGGDLSARCAAGPSADVTATTTPRP
ncbi:MAG: fatty acid desaturase [Betaproteobacteria bacterium]|nr:fatty acid desaturase [Betaproteobacteria bacterium]